MSLNRQARLQGSTPWYGYGDVSLLEAARRHAAKEFRYCGGSIDWTWVVEVRCETSPEIPVETYQVRTSVHAEVLDGRKGVGDE